MRTVLGLSWGGNSLGISAASVRFRSAVPFKSEQIALPASRNEQDAVIAECLARWKKEFSPDGVFVGVPQGQFSHHVIEMPALGRADMRNALLFELEKYLPLPVEEYLFDFLTIRSEGGKAQVLVLCAKKEHITKAARMLRDAGLEVLSVTCSSLAACARMQALSGERNISGLFVTHSESSHEVLALKNGVPVFLKAFPASADIAPEFEKLGAQFSTSWYYSGNIESSLMLKYPGRKFQISVSEALVFSGLNRSRCSIDILPAEFAKQRKDPYPFIIGGIAAAAIAVFFFAGAMNYYKNWRTLKEIDSRRQSLKTTAAGVLEIRKRYDQLQADRTVLFDFLARSNTAVRALNHLSNVMPANAWLINMSADDKGKVEIEGFTGRTSSLVITLEKSKVFRNIAFSSPINSKDGEERFSLKMETAGE